jgi:hypothetical protein
MSSKPTPADADLKARVDLGCRVRAHISTIAPNIEKAGVTLEQWNDIAADIYEAADVLIDDTADGLTPQQIREQRDELLAVLKALAKEHHDILASGDCGCTDPAKCDELIAANATIAKVEGRS